MPTLQERYDEAMFHFSQAEYDDCIAELTALLREDPEYFEAQLALGMALYRKGDYTSAIAEGHLAEKMKPKDQLVHTNLSLFYMKAGDKTKAEHHGLQARIAGWRENMTPPTEGSSDPELQIARPTTPPAASRPIPQREMPWKKKPPASAGDNAGLPSSPSPDNK